MSAKKTEAQLLRSEGARSELKKKKLQLSSGLAVRTGLAFGSSLLPLLRLGQYSRVVSVCTRAGCWCRLGKASTLRRELLAVSR